MELGVISVRAGWVRGSVVALTSEGSSFRSVRPAYKYREYRDIFVK